MQKIFLVSYCTDKDIDYLKRIINSEDILVGVDQGTDLLLKKDLSPDYIIGDFDSFSIKDNELPKKTKVLKLNPIKDETDLEYAIRYFQTTYRERRHPTCIKSELQSIIIVNNLQGRIDHILSVVHLLEIIECGYLWSADQEIYLPKNHFYSEIPLNSTISLIPLTESVKNITTKGLLYRLDNESLLREKSKGVSNKNVDKKVEINFSVGKLLIIINKGAI